MTNKITFVVLSGLYLLALSLSGVANINFAKAQTIPLTYFISGSIKVVSAPLSNVKVILYKGSKKSIRVKDTKTDNAGNYSFTVNEADVYVVKPASGGFVFNPTHRLIEVNKSVSGVDFLGTPR